jgi:hypothetical protein
MELIFRMFFGIPLLITVLVGIAVFVIMKMLTAAKFLKSNRVLISVSIVIGLAAGIYALSLSLFVNNQEKIALAILYKDDVPSGQMHKPHPSPALTGALNGKFPPGTTAENLKSFVADLGGNCHQGQLGQPLPCRIDVFTTICISHSITITAHMNNSNQIEGIEATRMFDAC